jgi:hypothetical protein
MKTRITSLVTAAALTLFGAALTAQTISYDYDKGADFSKFRTYAWVGGATLPDQINHARIVGAVDAQLASRGMVKVTPGGEPDVLVAYHATFDKNLRINGFSSGWGGYRFAGSRTGTATTEEFLVGTLAVDVVDAQSKSIVWRSRATKELDAKATPEKRDKNIRRAVEKLFEKYPTGAAQ